MVDEFYSVFMARKLKENVGKNKVMVFERRELVVVDFNTPYRVSVPAVGRCEVDLGRENEGSESAWEQCYTNMEMKEEIRNFLF